ncbi:uncharacterized protein DNG_06680 [Cephalotrichum gorgonifer]|uniref:C2H2-type domain-containing protein n=1 Tax=Cephalotrichum gorgonifer TaxID=2041049 RepID=A0AAE8N0V9_9PEZI|nr:uncharacterized protein DNG_06680 [Cephalotrichum gorgonifer]
MSAGPWHGEDAAQPSHPAAPFNDEEMARHLATSDDQASIISSSTYASSAISEEPASIFDGASIKSFSDNASIFSVASSKAPARQSTCSLVQTQLDTAHPQPVARSSQEGSPSSVVSPQSVRSGDSVSAPTVTAPKQKSSFMCSFCKEVGIVKTCTRKNDLKRHIEDFHHTNAQWACRYRGCQLVFDWQTAYKAHLKEEHSGSRMSPDEAKVNLCPQVVFACGFEHCFQLFEAMNDADAPNMFKEYVTHVVKHFDDGAQSGEWTYSRRMKNLLSQSQVHQAWASCGLDSVGVSSLQWDPQSSSILRKRLECRHIRDPAMLVHLAVSMGSNLTPSTNFPADFVTPLRDTCTESSHGHTPLKKPLQQHDPSGPFNFKISRGSDPALAQYFNSQRRLFVPPRQSTSSRRHTQPPPRQSIAPHPPSSSATNGLGHYSLLNSRMNSVHYDTTMSESLPPPSMYSQTSQPFGMGDSMMHQHSPQEFMGSDEGRGMRSSSPEADINMTDTPGPLPNLSMSYGGMMHAPRASDMSPHGVNSTHGMEQSNTFYHDEPRHSAPILNGDYMGRNL